MKISDPLFVRALDILTEGIDPGPGNNRKAPGKLTPPVIERVRDSNFSWMDGRTIVGFGISAKVVKGEPADPHQLALRIYVSKKSTPKKRKLKIPGSIRIPGLGQFPMDVIESGKVKPLGRTDRMRPARPGCSVAAGVAQGTMGCLVKLAGSKDLFVLGNSHILANDGARDPIDPTQDQGIYQPADDQIEENVIATLAKKVPYIFTDTGYPNVVDAAIGLIVDLCVSNDIIGIGIPTGVSTPISDPAVRKSGAFSGISQGKITDINGKFSSEFTQPNGFLGRVGFSKQVVVEVQGGTYFSQDGDSGSMLVNSTNQLVGMLWGGSEYDRTADVGSMTPLGICNDINIVFKKLSITLA